MGKPRLKNIINLVQAERAVLNQLSVDYHYMHRPIHNRASPFGWLVQFDGKSLDSAGKPFGFIVYASIHFTRLRNEFGYSGLPTKWQVLSLSRLWLNDSLPKNSATCVIGKSLKIVQRRWLEVHPPKYLDQPFHIVKIISYADTRFHKGTIYRAANFRESGETISRKRHRNTRGAGMDGAKLLRFIYDLPEPKWVYTPLQAGLFDSNYLTCTG